MKCQNCNIVQDNVCHVKENTKHFELILSLPFTYIFSVNISRPRTTITVDDSREPECCEYFFKQVLWVHIYTLGNVLHKEIIKCSKFIIVSCCYVTGWNQFRCPLILIPLLIELFTLLPEPIV